VKKPSLSVGLGFVLGSLAALALAQHSPAPDGPAESGLKTNRGGVHPPSPSDGTRFSPNPPPPMHGTEETPPAGKVKTEEKVATPSVSTTPQPRAQAQPTMNPKMTATPMPSGSTTPRPARTKASTKKPSRAKATPSPKAS